MAARTGSESDIFCIVRVEQDGKRRSLLVEVESRGAGQNTGHDTRRADRCCATGRRTRLFCRAEAGFRACNLSVLLLAVGSEHGVIPCLSMIYASEKNITGVIQAARRHSVPYVLAQAGSGLSRNLPPELSHRNLGQAGIASALCVAPSGRLFFATIGLRPVWKEQDNGSNSRHYADP